VVRSRDCSPTDFSRRQSVSKFTRMRRSSGEG